MTNALLLEELHYISDSIPGIQRKPRGDAFVYIGIDGKPIRETQLAEWCQALGIPPAWTDVWISPDLMAHILATGRDARGRKQYRYHPLWNERQAEHKFNRMVEFSTHIPLIRETTDAHLRQRSLSRERVLATIVRLLETTLIRIGNREYARDNDSYGLTTLTDDHVEAQGSSIEFCFVGKSGIEHVITVKDKRIARIVKACQELPGQHLFQYIDSDGKTHNIGSSDVNAYLREITGENFTAKDFRTWGGSTSALDILKNLPRHGESGDPLTKTEIKRNLSHIIKQTAAILGNTPTVCRKYYIHPKVLNAYPEQDLAAMVENQSKPANAYGLDQVEQALVALIQME